MDRGRELYAEILAQQKVSGRNALDKPSVAEVQWTCRGAKWGTRTTANAMRVESSRGNTNEAGESEEDCSAFKRLSPRLQPASKPEGLLGWAGLGFKC